MPKIPINEDRKRLSREHNIGFAGQIADVLSEAVALPMER